MQSPPPPPHPWTYAAYNMAAVVDFTAAVAAEVRRQEDAYDAMAEPLRVQKDLNDHQFAESRKKRYPPDSQLYHEQVLNYRADSAKELADKLTQLKDVYPLGYDGVDPTGALDTYQLRTKLLSHVARLEAERRAMAVAAGDGTASAVASFSPNALWRSSARVKTEEEASGAVTQQQRQHSPPPNQHLQSGDAPAGVTSSSPSAAENPASRVKREVAQRNRNGRTGAQALIGDGSQPSSAGEHATTDLLHPAPSTHVKLEFTGSPSSAFPPSWVSLKPEAAPPRATDADNGAYLTPHPTAPGAPFPRYASTPSLLRTPSLNKETGEQTKAQQQQQQQPTFVIATPPQESSASQELQKGKVTPSTANSLLNTQVSTQRQQQQRSVSPTPSARSGVNASQRRLPSQLESILHHEQPQTAAPGTVETDRITQLWWRLWPGQKAKGSATESQSESCEGSNTPNTTIRPTAVMVKAVATVAQRNIEREVTHCASQLGHVRKLLAQLAKDSSSAGVRGSGAELEQNQRVKGEKQARAGQTSLQERKRQKSDAHASASESVDDQPEKNRDAASDKTVLNRLELLFYRAHLTKKLSQLKVRKAELEKTVQELLGAIVSQYDEAEVAQDSRVTNYWCPGQKRVRRQYPRRGSSAPRQEQGGSSQLTAFATQERAAQEQQQEGDAVDSARLNSALVAAHKRALLHHALLHPRQLLRHLEERRDADNQWSATMPDESVFTNSSAIVDEIIELPTVEAEHDAYDLEQYMWPAELEARIQHVLHGTYNPNSASQRSHHVVLSQSDVRALEERCAASDGDACTASMDVAAVVPPGFESHIIELPNAGMHGWLYVQGRGEILVANLKLR